VEKEGREMKPEKRFTEEFTNAWNQFLARTSAEDIQSPDDWK
jgi:hypothetical protein